ncbi:MAG: hypothetical protein M3362_24440, partial [Acidobacteriota bacterium]|nr:hypothetical protein [Acidobacteriota bacterium]
ELYFHFSGNVNNFFCLFYSLTVMRAPPGRSVLAPTAGAEGAKSFASSPKFHPKQIPMGRTPILVQ